jgi:glucose-1-phosphate cytidylyltransferase
MKTIILAGGFGTRISEESHLKPKPMVTIGERPILWHIMKIYSHYGHNEFVICAGYKAQHITDYFANYPIRNSTVTFDYSSYPTTGKIVTEHHRSTIEPWKVTVAQTGYHTMTGGRIFKVSNFVQDGTFMLTYGDGVADIDINALLAFHRSHGKIATVTSVEPIGRFGALELDQSGRVRRFKEKPQGSGGTISAGFFVLEPKIFEYITGDIESCVFEDGPLEQLAADGELHAYQHRGFWQPMDTLRDRKQLEQRWTSPDCPWRIWE